MRKNEQKCALFGPLFCTSFSATKTRSHEEKFATEEHRGGGKIRNPKHEIRNKFECSKYKIRNK